MTHLPFVAAAYVLGTGVPIVFTIAAFTRLRAATRRLDAIDPRRDPNRGPRRSRREQ